jgi:hypothetical protein
MTLTTILACLIALTLPLQSTGGQSGPPQLAATSVSPPTATPQPIIRRDNRNTFVFDHLRLQASVAGTPFALEIGDGEIFQVLVIHTDASQFSYSIAATQDQTGPLTSTLLPGPAGVTPGRDDTVSLTMRHDQHFNRYRVTIAGLAAAGQPATPAAPATKEAFRTEVPSPNAPKQQQAEQQPQLYPIAFDLWVITRPQWKVTFSGGLALSTLSDQKFFISTDSSGNKKVQEDTASEEKIRHDVIALANIYFEHQYFRSLTFGAAVGIGDNGGSTPRYFIGPSVTVGGNLILTGGLTFGSIATLPVGQQLNQAPINGDNTLNALGSRFKHGLFFGAAFTFVDTTSAFKGAFSSSSTTPAPASTPAPGAGGTPATPAAVTLDALVGNYLTTDSPGKAEQLSATTSGGKAALPLTLTLDTDTAKALANVASVSFTTGAPGTGYTSADGAFTLTVAGSTGSIVITVTHSGQALFSAKHQ